MGTVQRWVMSVLAVTTIGHFAAGLVLAAVFMDSAEQVAPDRPGRDRRRGRRARAWPPASSSTRGAR